MIIGRNLIYCEMNMCQSPCMRHLMLHIPVFPIWRLKLREDTSLLHDHIDWKLEIQNINSGRWTPKLFILFIFSSSPPPYSQHLKASPLTWWYNHLASFTATKDPSGGCQSQLCIFLDTKMWTPCQEVKVLLWDLGSAQPLSDGEAVRTGAVRARLKPLWKKLAFRRWRGPPQSNRARQREHHFPPSQAPGRTAARLPLVTGVSKVPFVLKFVQVDFLI